MARLFSIKPSLTLKGRKFKGIRGFAGKPFHPPLTDIPIGAYIIGALFDTISLIFHNEPAAQGGNGGSGGFKISNLSHDLSRAATLVFVVGLIVSIPTAITGLWDWWKSTPKHTQAWRTANWHMAVMLFTTALVVVDVLWRLGMDRQPYTPLGLTLLSVAIAALVSLGSLYGGALVYEMGFNVETAGDSPVWHESETDIYPGQE